MSKESQVLIDAEIIRHYVLGSDQDREVLDKVYGHHLSGLREQLMASLFVEEINKLIQLRLELSKTTSVIRLHPVMYQNKGYMVKITVEEDKLDLV